uniref:Uncharacterized protein n=1 Tax=Caenorhabditis japonica TaxID=281687 RepID=A0A8R1IWL2_CAEJA
MAALKPSAPEIRKAAQEFVSYLNKAVTPFHATQEVKERLVQAGFQAAVRPRRMYGTAAISPSTWGGITKWAFGGV